MGMGGFNVHNLTNDDGMGMGKPNLYEEYDRGYR
jgi:hypothetical protein